MGKCKVDVEESAIVNTRTQAALAMAANATTTSTASKKIKKTTSYYSRRKKLLAAENFGTESDSTAAIEVVEVDDDEDVEVETENYCSGSEVITGTTPTSSDIPPSCCSSNENDDLLSKSDVVKDRCITDAEVESGEASSRYYDYHTTTTKEEERKEAREEATKSNGEDDSPAATKVPDEKSTVQTKMMPSESQIKEFFAAAEKDAQKRFIDKYNFDIVNDVPMEGRYEWVRITHP